MKRSETKKLIVMLNAGAFVAGAVFLFLAGSGRLKDNVGNQPIVIAAACIAIAFLMICFYVLKTRMKRSSVRQNGRLLRTVAELTAMVAVGVGVYLLPTLLAPGLAPMIWWALITTSSFLALLLVWSGRTRFE
ncbi:MAG TPA: hypothetical protein VFX38_01215 [Gammaproteobacteria bacterium]|nr:hypothetical protein [Gammaproteobacteria bacterium]